MGWLFELFGERYKETDSYKDADGKGIFERFQDAIQEEHDENLMPLADNLLANVVEPRTAYPRYVVYQESTLGFIPEVTLYLGNSMQLRRGIIRNYKKYVTIKGTKRCYRILLAMLGISVVFTEYFQDGGFDSSLKFDDPIRKFDSKCPPCSTYSMELTGTAPKTAELIKAIKSIIYFNNPINAILTQVTYNNEVLNTLTPDFNNDYNEDYPALN